MTVITMTGEWWIGTALTGPMRIKRSGGYRCVLQRLFEKGAGAR